MRWHKTVGERPQTQKQADSSLVSLSRLKVDLLLPFSPNSKQQLDDLH
jgi:hypothetical protein